jgi:hypothetical protein
MARSPHESSRYFYIFPKIVLSGRQTEIQVVPRDAYAGFEANTAYQVTLYPMDSLDTAEWNWKGPVLPAEVRGKNLVFSARFEGEQKYNLVIEALREGQKPEVVGDFAVYAVGENLHSRYPYKGDLHMHSHYSDGIESPPYVAAMCRKIGMDFMAVTDHGRYFPSLEAQQAFQNLPVDLRIYPGEEVHPPENPIHIVNFGGRFSVNELFTQDNQYKDEVADRQAQITHVPAGANPYWYASALWCFDKIREAGGLGIFCHPYWFANRMVRIPESLTSALLETQPYDALEVLGGYFRHEADANMLQVVRYYEETAKGKRIPIVGVSDAHGCHKDLFGWYYTLVFSPSPELGDLVNSILSQYSVAVEALPGELVHVYGPFRLVKYALFVLEELMPAHDELCAEEGGLMLAHLAGDPEAAEKLRRNQGRAQALLRAFLHGI